MPRAYLGPLNVGKSHKTTYDFWIAAFEQLPRLLKEYANYLEGRRKTVVKEYSRASPAEEPESALLLYVKARTNKYYFEDVARLLEAAVAARRKPDMFFGDPYFDFGTLSKHFRQRQKRHG
jgi:hypothetical protein